MRGRVQSRVPRLSREIPGRLQAVDAVCRDLADWLGGHGLEAARFALELVARECLNNAILHGNGHDARKRVRLGVGCGPRWISLSVADEGPGFRWRTVRRSLPEQDTRPGGRGLAIAALYADRVRFNRRGNQITVWLPRPDRKGTV